MANDLVHLKARVDWEWQKDILHEFHSVVDELDKKRAVTICDHFKIDLSDLRKFIDSKQKPQTNADRIRSMTDEELAEWLEAHCYQYGWLEWLRKEPSNGNTDT